MMAEIRCAMCGLADAQEKPARRGEDMAEVRSQIASLRQRLEDLRSGQLTPKLVHQQLPSMCPMCVDAMRETTETSRPGEREQIERRLHQRIERLEQREAELAGSAG